jgi:23S rRNA A2030 N6-methylase RlmJ
MSEVTDYNFNDLVAVLSEIRDELKKLSQGVDVLSYPEKQRSGKRVLNQQLRMYSLDGERPKE